MSANEFDQKLFDAINRELGLLNPKLTTHKGNFRGEYFLAFENHEGKTSSFKVSVEEEFSPAARSVLACKAIDAQFIGTEKYHEAFDQLLAQIPVTLQLDSKDPFTWEALGRLGQSDELYYCSGLVDLVIFGEQRALFTETLLLASFLGPESMRRVQEKVKWPRKTS